jgi:hypothetical protein
MFAHTPAPVSLRVPDSVRFAYLLAQSKRFVPRRFDPSYAVSRSSYTFSRSSGLVYLPVDLYALLHATCSRRGWAFGPLLSAAITSHQASLSA